MHKSRRLRINDINPNLVCVLCSGYLIDATTIIECLHSFCRSCIVKYLEFNKYCPICDVQVHKTKPLLNIRSDQTLQDIVYKLVPGLFQNEMCRRRDFYSQHPEQKPSSAEESGEVTQFSHIYTADESISLSLEYYNNNEVKIEDDNNRDTKTQPHPSRRYLRCPAAVSVQHLQKLIRAKYGLSNQHRVDILYMNDRLREDFTLMDIAYIYLWRRKVPLHLTYRIFEVAKKIKLEDFTENEKATIKQDDNESSNKTWKEVQLTISENGIMSVMNIEETKPAIENLEPVKLEIKPEKPLKDEPQKEPPPEPEPPKCEPKEEPKEVKKTEPEPEVKVGEKRKLESDLEQEPSAKIPKSSVTKPSTTPLKNIQQLSRNHPLKIHSQTIKNHSNVQTNKPVQVKTPLPPPKPSSAPLSTGKALLNNNNNNNKTSNNKISIPVTTVQNNLPVQRTPNIPKSAEVPIKTPISEVKTAIVTTGVQNPIPVPKTSISNLQNVPKYTQASQSNDNTMTTNTKFAETSIQHSSQRAPVQVANSIQYSKVGIVPRKSPAKLGSPIGYKTLRDPPKAWNPQISRQSLVKSAAFTCTTTASTSDARMDMKLPGNKPAKFFKMRNNMPRYLGNPASGVKPMYQVRDCEAGKPPSTLSSSLPVPVDKKPDVKKPEKKEEKSEVETATGSYNGPPKINIEKIEVRKHASMIKIDPKTLRPIPEKNETQTCSDLPEMKINQSTVPILNPLRTQKSQTSPKIDRRSPKTTYLDINPPKSPMDRSSPKINTKNCQSTSKPLNSPTSKKDKPNLNFTPPNPFIPNLTSPNLAPNQFLFPNYPSYDPRVINNLPYHNLPLGLSMFYSQPRLGYPGLSTQNLPLTPSLMSSLNLEASLNKNLRVTKSYDIPTQLSPTIDKKLLIKKPIEPRETFNGECFDKDTKNNKLKASRSKVEKQESKPETKPEDKPKEETAKRTEEIEKKVERVEATVKQKREGETSEVKVSKEEKETRVTNEKKEGEKEEKNKSA